GAGAPGLGTEAPVDDLALADALVALEGWAAKVDELTTDSRQDALMQIVLPPGRIDLTGATVIFCAHPATVDYVDQGLRLLNESSMTLPGLRGCERSIADWLRAPRT